ncbi:efflux RND transporter periplasmic adaptor subunit [Jatrophihabitans endophyticus]|uniref:efflux RND transporter periplasmic adaptor subunit n=1 Tax=Jatrophihabitans endophyticus TaxID=1206085 RepID=UPI0019F41762|nr:efflux RND transporter periplasmic adaptor subunit [Jatrophihabitans endophyticus]MBE7190242.1 efflux RND transporter periplasmic adaptor subunit [Jatrophihabitans endophyticus]
MTRNEIDQPTRPPGTDRPARHEQPGRGAPPRSRTRRGLSFIGTALIIIIIGAAVFYAYKTLVPTGEKPATKTAAGGPPPTVGVATIGRGDIEIDVEALGTVTPIANITVKTQIDGQLTGVGFKEGQLVKAGDFLAQIDPRPYLALLHQYEGQLAHDQGLLDEAITDEKRYATLLAQTSIARQQAEDQKYVVQQDQGQVESDKGLIEAQKVNLAFCHITAPVSGRVGLRQVDPGNYVQTTDTNGIVVLTQLQPISVIFSIPENVIPAVEDAQAKLTGKTAKLQTTAYDQADLNKLATGSLETLDNTIDTTTGQLKARAIFANPDNHLYPNQFVNIHLKLRELENVIVAPTSAVQRGTPGTFAYVVGSDDKVSVKKIELGPTQGAMVAITGGLAQGDRVVVDGSDRLRDGLKVRVAGVPHAQAGQHGKP